MSVAARALGAVRGFWPAGPAGWALAAILVAGVVVRGFAAHAWSPTINSLADSIPYAVYAEQGPLENPQHPGGYSAFLAAVGFFSRDIDVTMVLQNLLGFGSALLLFAATRRVTGSPWPALIPAAVVVLGADQILLEHTIMSETLFTFALAASLYACLRALETPSPWWGWPLAAGVVVALSGTIRSQGVFLVPVAVLALLLSRPRPWLPRWRPGGGARRWCGRGADRLRRRQRDRPRQLRARSVAGMAPLQPGLLVRRLRSVHAAPGQRGPVRVETALRAPRRQLVHVQRRLPRGARVPVHRSGGRARRRVGEARDPRPAGRVPRPRLARLPRLLGSRPRTTVRSTPDTASIRRSTGGCRSTSPTRTTARPWSGTERRDQVLLRRLRGRVGAGSAQHPARLPARVPLRRDGARRLQLHRRARPADRGRGAAGRRSCCSRAAGSRSWSRPRSPGSTSAATRCRSPGRWPWRQRSAPTPCGGSSPSAAPPPAADARSVPAPPHLPSGGWKRTATKSCRAIRRTRSSSAAWSRRSARSPPSTGSTSTCPAGICLGLLGPNGAGKSTTMRLLTGQAIADSGELRVLGFELPRRGEGRARRDGRRAAARQPRRRRHRRGQPRRLRPPLPGRRRCRRGRPGARPRPAARPPQGRRRRALRRHAPPPAARPRARPRAAPGPARRADRRARPADPHRDVVADRRPALARGDDPDVDPLHRGGRAARRRGRGDGARQGRSPAAGPRS